MNKTETEANSKGQQIGQMQTETTGKMTNNNK
jgi:hypothetical protein